MKLMPNWFAQTVGEADFSESAPFSVAGHRFEGTTHDPQMDKKCVAGTFDLGWRLPAGAVGNLERSGLVVHVVLVPSIQGRRKADRVPDGGDLVLPGQLYLVSALSTDFFSAATFPDRMVQSPRIPPASDPGYGLFVRSFLPVYQRGSMDRSCFSAPVPNLGKSRHSALRLSHDRWSSNLCAGRGRRVRARLLSQAEKRARASNVSRMPTSKGRTQRTPDATAPSFSV